MIEYQVLKDLKKLGELLPWTPDCEMDRECNKLLEGSIIALSESIQEKYFFNLTENNVRVCPCCDRVGFFELTKIDDTTNKAMCSCGSFEITEVSQVRVRVVSQVMEVSIV